MNSLICLDSMVTPKELVKFCQAMGVLWIHNLRWQIVVYSLLILCALPVKAQTTYATPQAAAKALFEAWRTKNRTKALQVANDESVDKLMGTIFRKQRKLTECHDASDTEKGLYYCVYGDSEDELLSVAFYMTKTRKGWKVKRVSFAAEE
ncbi:hypothetical protein QNI19_22505 [Cytophagaceae bacterium DM2B3-1]|uniref:Uncharacterized protein n=2 Tax=Xanthocytophaga flava TaxID=3048013 RepID=A0ABT7CRX8_9BACT|nr:hypothetical protein [Xanthocytophaga flavus]